MALLPARNIFDGTKTPATTTSDMKTALGSLRDYLAACLGTDSATPSMTSLNGGAIAGLHNRIINGGFNVNQTGVTGSVSLGAGVYGHDGWKAGAGGCNYTFAVSANVVTLTISAGTLIQVIEGANVESAVYMMNWIGTSQGRRGGGTYANSPTSLAATPGSNLTVEFGTGTLSQVQVEPGLTPSKFEFRPFSMELLMCQRLYCQSFPYGTTPTTAPDVGTLLNSTWGSYAVDSLENNGKFTIEYPVEMRTAPTVALRGYTGNAAGWGCQGTTAGGTATSFSGSAAQINTRKFMIISSISARQYNVMGHWTADARL